MKCTRCGTVLPDVGGGPYCSKCGAPQVIAVPLMGPPRTSGMAIAGFVLSFFCSVLGLIFSILGYNECKRSAGVVRGQGLALAGIIISGLFLVVGLLAAVAIPAFLDYMSHSRKSPEAQIELRKLETRAKSLYITHGGLPTASEPLTPAVPCCEQPGQRCRTTLEDWQTPGWMQLDFEQVGASDFQFSFESTPDSFEALAVGDPGCTGTRMTYRLRGHAYRGNLTFEPITNR